MGGDGWVNACIGMEFGVYDICRGLAYGHAGMMSGRGIG